MTAASHRAIAHAFAPPRPRCLYLPRYFYFSRYFSPYSLVLTFVSHFFRKRIRVISIFGVKSYVN